MSKSSSAAAANVVDLSAFRQKRMESRASEIPAAPPSSPAMMMPVWVCWVPVWAPVVT